MIFDIILDSFRNAVLITGLVVVMMMLLELLNIDSRGGILTGLRNSRIGQVVLSALLGVVPGCMGGFASVSLYTHGMISFGALVAMMIASSGDEAFVMLAMMPRQTMWICLVLLVIAIAVGIVTDLLFKNQTAPASRCSEHFDIHEEDEHEHTHEHRHFNWKRLLMFVGVAVFIAALLSGLLEHEHEAEHVHEGGINLLSEEWMNWLFGGFSLIVLAVLIFGNDHFVEEHLWHHIVVKHLPSVFLWSFGVLLVIGFGLHYLDLDSWIGGNTALMIVLATLVGIIPESGPHLIFVTLYASGIVPLPVLLASCISQDGHASLPLLAESRSSYLKAKAVNCAVALLTGFCCMLFMA